jgi:hypothetical protein
MALTRRGVVASVAATLIVAGAVAGAVVFLGGKAGVGPLANGSEGGNESPSTSPSAPPSVCPLTGLPPANGTVPNRRALAVKVENLPAARPQTGLSWADIVYEEPVEAGITRFIAVYQCQDASRIEPIRSGRLTDPDILAQFGHPIFAYAGGVPQVITKAREAGLVDVNMTKVPSAYHRDPDRPQPHNLYSSSRELYAVTHVSAEAPEPVFTYSTKRPKASRVDEVHLPFSQYSDVFWKWGKKSKRWYRWHGDVPHTLSDGTQVSAVNVVVQVVKVKLTGITDVNGVRSPEVVATGSGKAYVFRNGRMIEGTWSRPKLGDVTKFLDSKGNEIPLMPGNTWVELLPSDIPVSTS